MKYILLFYFLLALFLCLNVADFIDAAASVPQLHQKAPRKITNGLIKIKNYQLGPVIPGLQQGGVPQGIAYSKRYHLIFISFYFDTHIPSAISVIDSSSHKAIGTFSLKESADDFHYGHVGGLAIHDPFISVSSENKIYKYQLADLVKGASSKPLLPVSSATTETNASFAGYHKNILFVGEFAHGSRYPTKISHHMKNREGLKHYAWVCGYDIDQENHRPKLILSIRQNVQGIYITDDYIFLSISYGRRNRSVIAVYNNPLRTQPHTKVTFGKGEKVPLWYLDGKNLIKEIDFPPMSEGITLINGKLAVLSESGAQKYQKGGMGPLDYLILIDWKAHL